MAAATKEEVDRSAEAIQGIQEQLVAMDIMVKAKVDTEEYLTNIAPRVYAIEIYHQGAQDREAEVKQKIDSIQKNSEENITNTQTETRKIKEDIEYMSAGIADSAVAVTSLTTTVRDIQEKMDNVKQTINETVTEKFDNVAARGENQSIAKMDVVADSLRLFKIEVRNKDEGL